MSFESPHEIPHIKRLHEKMFNAQKEDTGAFLDKIADFAHGLQERHSDYIDYRLYHLLVGSTPRPGHELKEEDFEREDSIVAFIESL